MSGDTSVGYWLFMAFGLAVTAAIFYAWHRWVMSKTAGGPSGRILASAVLLAAGSVVFLLIGVGTWVVSLF